MKDLLEISYLEIEKKTELEELSKKVLDMCFKEEELYDSEVYVSIILTDEKNIQRINKEFRKIDKPTDVLSFPMFEQNEIEKIKHNKEVLGDIIICLPIVLNQAEEYGHSLEREFAYMLVHGFYHIMGYDHIKEEDKKVMRKKEENVLSKLGIVD